MYSWWVTDPTQTLNRRTGIYTLFDGGKNILRGLLSPQRTQARDLEDGFALLLSLHGFTVSKLGKVQDAPDILAETTSGKLAIIECTTDLPDKNDKLTKLVQRTIKIRSYLSKSLQPYSEVLAILVTTLTEAEAEPHRELVAKSGVALVCREQIDDLLLRLELSANPDQLYEEAKRLVPRVEGDLFG